MKHMLNRGMAATALIICILLASPRAQGELADLANAPLGVGSSTAVQPNMMVMFPNDGTTFYDFSPPQLINPVCKICSGGSCSATDSCFDASFIPTLYHYW